MRRLMSMMRHTKRFIFAVALLASLVLSQGQAAAQDRDSLLNGALIGGAIGAGIGIAFTHAVRDSDPSAGQYGYGALVFGAIGAGAGPGVDALLDRSPRPAATRSGLFVAPAVGRVNGVAVVWRWGTERGGGNGSQEQRRNEDKRRASGPLTSVPSCHDEPQPQIIGVEWPSTSPLSVSPKAAVSI